MTSVPGMPVATAPAQDRSLLSGLSHELALMVPMVEGLSGLVMDHAVQADPADRARILAQAQVVDDLGQRLQALIEITRAVAAGTMPEDALKDVGLADLATRLRSALAGDDAPPIDAGQASGDLMLFDQP